MSSKTIYANFCPPDRTVPCYECKERKVGCHGTCPRYLKYFNSKRKENKMVYEKTHRNS